MRKVNNLVDLFSLAIANPALARSLKSDPRSVAQMFEVKLTDEEADAVSQRLDIDAILGAATTADSMADKVAQGIGLREQSRA
jgi:hypothetical protein